ncbi:MAG: hypothetical protein A3F43_00470 [Gammaproteobacteria bacterium RIFCSPHIGHO2_12_FULL_42_10]|nr:MAG: hypothetical protein A3F43_00470 [Gammaproteobacteria bacterium RIFCSPHIGHO2_12_FULL_42_10]
MRAVVILFLFFIHTNTWAINATAKQKYHYQLLTDDYGILTENDLAKYAAGMKPMPYTDKSSTLNYWQCFPRDHISITLEDMGYSSENFGWKDTLADIKITAWIKPGVIQEYRMRAMQSASDYENSFRFWRKLMKNQKYVCLAGNIAIAANKIGEDGITREVHSWTFDKIKTKNGCDSYFDGQDC